MGTFQLEVQNNLSKAYKETKGPKQFRKKRKRCVICTHFFVYMGRTPNINVCTKCVQISFAKKKILMDSNVYCC
jgi:hypothetical protein